MAGVCTQYYGKTNEPLYEFACDTQAEVQDAPTTVSGGRGVFAAFKNPAPIGSTLIVGNGNGELLVYMLFSSGWKQI